MIDPDFIDELSVDYWYDEGFQFSIHTLQNFDECEWQELSVLWNSQSIEWQERLAYILGDGAVEREANLLINMFCRADKQVSLGAAESLRGMDFILIKQAAQYLTYGDSLSIELAKCESTNELLKMLAQAAGFHKKR
ncbi:hypothetical protein H8L32_03375 [Undibacterium sp. CY18W]|uniref:Uncharacterized protein n=1 Tax=Undibacterium hunanense TaxID=2762292 RepID=A0ABR6ZKU7_9BURK|nr:hypothetical protein [Undibacterium hunanense]MBC3916517.1 hypothetical protein [Undibacterium hunanense]